MSQSTNPKRTRRPTAEDRLRQIVRLGASIRATAWEAAQAQLAAIRYERRRGAA
ncbi:hypothetical protein [Pseudoxanthomonas winnipegensis]|uniref:hypothetical protein n=1 Tax=Pseudoxanthomonas winnipegensis TaxID=2480810 RepID=UPI0013EEA24A|nr:hypothetical protein [Pseudoxanthomonas winnipegensis]